MFKSLNNRVVIEAFRFFKPNFADILRGPFFYYSQLKFDNEKPFFSPNLLVFYH